MPQEPAVVSLRSENRDRLRLAFVMAATDSLPAHCRFSVPLLPNTRHPALAARRRVGRDEVASAALISGFGVRICTDSSLPTGEGHRHQR
jgi:hypothetical protein